MNSTESCPLDLFCTEEEIFELLAGIDTTKSNGPDGISGKMLKSTASSITPALTKLFNLSIKVMVSYRLNGSWHE